MRLKRVQTLPSAKLAGRITARISTVRRSTSLTSGSRSSAPSSRSTGSSVHGSATDTMARRPPRATTGKARKGCEEGPAGLRIR